MTDARLFDFFLFLMIYTSVLVCLLLLFAFRIIMRSAQNSQWTAKIIVEPKPFQDKILKTIFPRNAPTLKDPAHSRLLVARLR